MRINFVTTNSHKFEVAQHFFEQAGLQSRVDLRQHDQETPEIQADTVQEVALSSAKWIGDQLQQPVVVADAGLSIRALQGFPGPYMKYVNGTLSPENILAMMEGESDRTAEFIDALAYYDPHTETSRIFTSVTLGSIAAKLTPVEGSTVDRLFIADSQGVPLVEMSAEDRTTVWDTSRWQQLTDFLMAGQPQQ